METVESTIARLWNEYCGDVREGFVLHRMAEDREMFSEFGAEFSRELAQHAWENYAEGEAWAQWQRDWQAIIADGLRAGIIAEGSGTEAAV